jgi:hypothetical protein
MTLDESRMHMFDEGTSVNDSGHTAVNGTVVEQVVCAELKVYWSGHTFATDGLVGL